MCNLTMISIVTTLLVVGGPAGFLPALATAGDLTLPSDSHDEATVRYTGDAVAKWEAKSIGDEPFSISPTITFGPGVEINHHRVTVRYAGTGSVKVSVASRAANQFEDAIKRMPAPRSVESGAVATFAGRYRGDSAAWILVQKDGSVQIAEIAYTCWRGKGTLYGHEAGTFRFASATLPFRLMYPRNYDSQKSYPLVISVSGSGGVGNDNARSMESVILAGFLFTRYYHEPELECFSLVAQIPSSSTVPAPYHPKGKQGAPTPRYHPDWPAVNEGSWYTDATLALIKRLIADDRLPIDADRIYYTGFSYGGKACWEFLRAGREEFAGAICGAGWPIGRAYSKPDEALLERLRLEIQRHRHIPVWIFAGEKDAMRFGSEAIFRELQAIEAKAQYSELPGATHGGSAGGIWTNDEHVKWLFEQNRAKNPPPSKDPYPGGSYPEGE